MSELSRMGWRMHLLSTRTYTKTASLEVSSQCRIITSFVDLKSVLPQNSNRSTEHSNNATEAGTPFPTNAAVANSSSSGHELSSNNVENSYVDNTNEHDNALGRLLNDDSGKSFYIGP